jgi:hypothetical protein
VPERMQLRHQVMADLSAGPDNDHSCHGAHRSTHMAPCTPRNSFRITFFNVTPPEGIAEIAAMTYTPCLRRPEGALRPATKPM